MPRWVNTESLDINAYVQAVVHTETDLQLQQAQSTLQPAALLASGEGVAAVDIAQHWLGMLTQSPADEVCHIGPCRSCITVQTRLTAGGLQVINQANTF